MAKVYLDANETYIGASNATIYGGTGTEKVLVQAGVVATFDATVERVELAGALGDYTFQMVGTACNVLLGGVIVATFNDISASKTIAFTNGSAALVATGIGTATLGGAAITTTAAAAAAALNAGDPSTVTGGGGTPVTPTFSVAAAAATVTEGGSATFTVTLSAAQATDATVDYAVNLGSGATAADVGAYTPTGTLTFAAGETTKTITIPVLNDSLTETGETVGVTLSNAATGFGLGTTTATTVLLDAAAPTYTIAADASSVTEGNNVVFTVTSDVAQSVDRVMNYQIAGVEVAGGTATPASDLGVVTGTVTILAGQTTGTFTLTPTDDGVVEGFEGFNVSVLDASFATVATSGNVVIMDGAEAGKTFTLGVNADILTGTTGGDTFDGSQNSAGTDTFSSLDSLDGGAGNDTLYAVSKSGSPVSPAGLKNIETVNVTSTANGSGVNFASSTGVTTINLMGSSATAFATGLTSAALNFAVKNTSQNGTFTFSDTALTGSSDTVTVTIENVSAGTVTVQPTGGTTTNGVETVSIMSTGSGSNVLTGLDDGPGTSWTTLNVSGDQGIDLGAALPTTVVKLTSTLTSTTGVTASLGAGAPVVVGGAGNDSFSFITTAGNVSVDGGAGNDTFTFNGTDTITSADTVAGGEGTNDKIVSTSAEAVLIGSTLTNVTGVEHLQISDASTGAINASYFGAGINQVTFANGVANTGTLTLNNGDTTVTLKGTSNATAFNFTPAGSATTDSVTIKTDTTDRTNNKTFTGTGVETLTFDTTNAALTASTITLTGSGSAATAVKFTGTKSFTGTTIEAKTIDASAMVIGSTSNGLVLTGAATTNTAQVITGTGGKDTLFGGSGNDTITAGDGADAITTGAGSDIISGGAGNDTLTFGDNLGSGDSIDGGDGTDTLSITATSVTTLNALSLSAVLALNDRISNVEKLSFSNDFGASFDLSRADGISDVTLAAASNAAYTLSSFGATNKLTITQATNDVNVTLGDASGSSDIFNVVLQNAATTNFGTLTVGTTASTGQIETVNVITTEGATANSTVRSHTLALDAAAGLKTLNLSGTETVISTVSSEALATIDASGLTEGAAQITATSSLVNMTVTGSANNDTFSTGSGNDVVNGLVGDDTLTGGSGNDTLDGGAGNDTIVNGVGVDSLVGGDGVDTLSQTGWTISTTTDGGSTAVLGTVVNLGATSVSAATIAGYVGYSTTAAISSDLSAIASNTSALLGVASTIGSRVDVLSGFENVIGSTGKDYIVGSSSANTITGGTGADVLTGGSAADTFVFATADSVARSVEGLTEAGMIAGETITFGNGVDVITDFVSGTDKLDVTTDTNYTLVSAGDALTGKTLTHNYSIRGNYVASTGVFTQAAAGDDSLVFADIANADLANAANTTVMVLVGVTTLTTADFI